MDDGPARTIAAVDLGSNSFHMKVARVAGAQVTVVDRMRDMVQLAAGLDARNLLTPGAMDRAVACLERFGQRLRGLAPEDVRAVGTNTLRRAGNAAEFLPRAEAALGHPIEIVAGREEARLIYLGVAHQAPRDEQQRLVVDIGGGSTELIVGRRLTPILAESLYMGCVGMSRDHFPDGAVTARAMRGAEIAALQELEPVQAAYRDAGWSAALGSSGTILAIARIVGDQGWEPRGGIGRGGLARLRERLVAAGHVDAIRFADVRPARAAVLPGGLAILGATFEALGIERIHTVAGALREGLIHDLAGRREHVDAQAATVADLARRFQVDAAQAARVERTARYLRARLARPWRLRKEAYANLLAWAARLHELGLAIAHNQHHKHGAYVLEHADMPGFSRDEQLLLATLVRSHRRKFPLAAFGRLRGKRADRARRLGVCLRLAVVLHRSRAEAPLPPLGVALAGERLTLVFPPGWLDAHPLTAADLATEAGYLRAAGLALELR